MPQEIKLLKEEGTFDLIIPEDVEKKIRYMCQKVSAIEWSGTLFFKSEGKYEDDTLVIRCVDFFLMDIGSAAYTEFDMSPDVVGYITENPELLDCQMGLIHSHNNMSTFFSGTDTNTLLAEGKDRNHFVSLIVNNAGTYTAGITRLEHTISEIKEKGVFHTFQDEIVDLEGDTYTEETTSVIWRDLNVIKEGVEGDFSTLDTRMAEIKEAKAAKPSYVGFSQPKYDYFGKTTIDGGDEEFAWGRSKYPDSHQLETYKPISETPSYKPTTSASELSDEVITKALKQLITGSVILPNDSKINLTQWAKNMENLFDRRFRTMKDFESWAVNYVDFLVWDLNDPDKINTDDTCLIGSQQMLDMLGDLPTNKYIKSFISILEGYSYKD
jgi:proteasome lid subunit RPN8/RPN11